MAEEFIIRNCKLVGLPPKPYLNWSSYWEDAIDRKIIENITIEAKDAETDNG